MNDALEQYLLEIKRLLPCNAKEKKRYLEELRADIADFLELTPDASAEDVQVAFGTPRAIAESFMANTNPEQVFRRISAKRKIAIGVIAIAALLAIVVGIVAIRIANSVNEIQNGYFVDYIADSTETEPPITSETKVY